MPAHFPINYDAMPVIICIYIIYIYIYTNLLTNSTYGDRDKEKTPPEFVDNNISRITARGKKKKVIGRKERKGQLCHTNQLVKRTKTHRKMLRSYNYKECSILGRAK